MCPFITAQVLPGSRGANTIPSELLDTNPTPPNLSGTAGSNLRIPPSPIPRGYNMCQGDDSHPPPPAYHQPLQYQDWRSSGGHHVIIAGGGNNNMKQRPPHPCHNPHHLHQLCRPTPCLHLRHGEGSPSDGPTTTPMGSVFMGHLSCQVPREVWMH